MNNKIQDGQTVDYTPSADVASGAVVVFAGCVGVAATAIKAGKKGVLEMAGVFEAAKDNTAMALGQKLYAKTDGTITATATSNVVAGVCWADAAGGDGKVTLKINV